ncbi:MAG: SBBP repeat-containing protein, partial [Acidobacteriia bacterium]|nr:SBBP repeat-containing protein [Terriglobia bacterium]
MRFEASADSHSKFQARGSNYVLSLSPDRSVLEWRDAKHRRTSRVTTRLVGANSAAAMEPEDHLAGSANYLLGPQSAWRTGVAGFGKIRHREVYAGIDLVFHGEEGRLEYDFALAPHADPSLIRLELSGQQSMRIAENGDLVVVTAAGEVRWKRPELYQGSNGARTPVEGRFVLRGRRTVAFEVGRYDRGRALVIDPTLAYSTYLGSTANEAARGIALDAAGNVYIAGSTTSTDLSTVSTVQPNFGGLTANIFTGDGFIAKFSPSGTLLYLTYLGGSRDDGISAIAVDSAGNAYLTGGTTSTDFPTVNPYQSRFGGAGSGGVAAGVHTGDAFVAKLNPPGTSCFIRP